MSVARDPIRVKAKVRKKAGKPTGVFGGLAPATAPIKRAQTQAHKQTQRATQKVERNVVVPAIPKLKHPTQQQRGAAQSQVAQSLHRQGINTPQQVAALPKAQRKRVNRATGYARTNAKNRNVANLYASQTPGREAELADMGSPAKQRAVAIARNNAGLSMQELAALGRRDVAQVKSGDQHTRLHLPGATIDATALGSEIGQHLKGNPIAAFLHGTNKITAFGAKHGGIPGRALKEAVDLPANTVTSTYLVGKAAVTGHPEKAAKMLVDPVVQTIKHPVKSFEQHPLSTVLIFRGVKGAAGHGAGKVMRTGAVGKTAKQAASVARPAKEIPGTAREVRQQYSKDPSSKAVQVAVERTRRGRAVRKGHPDPTRVASKREVQATVDADVQAAKLVTAEHQARVADKASHAIGYTRKGRRKGNVQKPTAAVSLAAQGITDGTKADLGRYLKDVQAKASTLKGDKLKANQKTQALIKDALKHYDEGSVKRAAAAYSDVSAELEPKVLAHNLVDPAAAESARLAGVKVRRVTRSSSPETRAVRRTANKDLKRASIAADQAEARFITAKAEVRASRKSNGEVPDVQAHALERARVLRDDARDALTEAKATAHAASTTHIRAHLGDSPEPAFVSQQPIKPRAAAIQMSRPKVPVTKMRTGQAVRRGTLDVHPAKLVEQVAGTQRTIDAAEARNSFIDGYGYRARRGEVPQAFRTDKGAKAFAEKKLDHIGSGWEPIKQQDGQYALIPADVAQRLRAHEEKVQTNHPLARAMGAQWRRNVLGFSPRWLFGNQLEGALRSVVAGAGPTSYVTAKRSLKELSPAEREQALARTVGGGQYSTSDRIAHERNIARDAEDLGHFAKAVQKLQQTKSVGALSQAYGAYTNFVFRSLNGRLENQFQTAMLGKALRDHPLMDDHIAKLSQKAVSDAANGLRDTDTLVELGRQVDRMYGRYGKFSPGLQEMIANYTPFIAWTLNATNFLYHVLPADHPVLTALLASANQSTEGWRKAHGSYLDVLGKTSGQLPPWLQNSIPGKDGSHLRIGRYTPFGLLNSDGAPVVGGIQSLVLPQLSEIMSNLAGKDWQGNDLSRNPSGARDLLAAVASFAEGQVPLAAQGVHVAGVHLPNMKDGSKVTPGVGTRAREQFDPLRYTPGKKPTVRKSSSSGGVSWGDQGGGITWGDQGSGVTWGG